MSDRLIATMKAYGLKAEVLGTEDEPSPGGQAIGDMLMRILSLEDKNAELERVARQAHDAMMDWHFVHGLPSDCMSDEEKEMGAACRAIDAVLDGADDA